MKILGTIATKLGFSISRFIMGSAEINVRHQEAYNYNTHPVAIPGMMNIVLSENQEFLEWGLYI